MSYLAHRDGTSRKPANLPFNLTLPSTPNVTGRRGSTSDTERKSVDILCHARSQPETPTVPAATSTTASPTIPEFQVPSLSSFEQPGGEASQEGTSSPGGDDSRLSFRSIKMQTNLTRQSTLSDSSLYTKSSTVTNSTCKRSSNFSGGASKSSDATSAPSLRTPPASSSTTGFDPLTCAEGHVAANTENRVPEVHSISQAPSSGHGASAPQLTNYLDAPSDTDQRTSTSTFSNTSIPASTHRKKLRGTRDTILQNAGQAQKSVEAQAVARKQHVRSSRKSSAIAQPSTDTVLAPNSGTEGEVPRKLNKQHDARGVEGEERVVPHLPPLPCTPTDLPLRRRLDPVALNVWGLGPLALQAREGDDCKSAQRHSFRQVSRATKLLATLA